MLLEVIRPPICPHLPAQVGDQVFTIFGRRAYPCGGQQKQCLDWKTAGRCLIIILESGYSVSQVSFPINFQIPSPRVMPLSKRSEKKISLEHRTYLRKIYLNTVM